MPQKLNIILKSLAPKLFFKTNLIGCYFKFLTLTEDSILCT